MNQFKNVQSISKEDIYKWLKKHMKMLNIICYDQEGKRRALVRGRVEPSYDATRKSQEAERAHTPLTVSGHRGSATRHSCHPDVERDSTLTHTNHDNILNKRSQTQEVTRKVPLYKNVQCSQV